MLHTNFSLETIETMEPSKLVNIDHSTDLKVDTILLRIGNPSTDYTEAYLNILQAVRLHAILGMAIAKMPDGGIAPLSH